MLLLVYLPRRELRRDLLVLVEVALEPARREALHDPDGLGARVAQSVGHPPWLEDGGAGRGDHDLAADVARQLALEHEVALVLAGVRGYHHPRGETPLLDRERTAGVLRPDLVDYVQDGEVGALVRAD